MEHGGLQSPAGHAQANPQYGGQHKLARQQRHAPSRVWIDVRLSREERGGADPGLDSLEEHEPEAHWQSPLSPAQLSLALALTALQLNVEPSPADWSLIAQVRLRWLTPEPSSACGHLHRSQPPTRQACMPAAAAADDHHARQWTSKHHHACHW